MRPRAIGQTQKRKAREEIKKKKSKQNQKNERKTT
jgi:hypothetical protein